MYVLLNCREKQKKKNFIYIFIFSNNSGFLTFLNSYDVRITTKLQDVFMFSKIGALGIVIITGLIALYMGVNDNFSSEKVWQNTATDPGQIAVSFYSGIFSYCGW